MSMPKLHYFYEKRYLSAKLLNPVESTLWKSDAVVTRKADYSRRRYKDGLPGEKSDGRIDGTSEVKGVILCTLCDVL